MATEKLNYYTTIKFLFKYIAMHKKNYILFYFGWLFDALLKIFTPIMFAVMIDEIVYYNNIDVFLKISLSFVIMLLFACVIHFFCQAQYAYLEIMFTFDIKKDVYKAMQAAQANYMSDAKTGDIINIIQSYSNECMVFVIRNIIHTINNLLSLIVYIAYILVIGWQFGLLMLVSVPISIYITSKFGRKVRNYSDEKRVRYDAYNGWLFEMFSGIRDIRMLGAKNRVNKSFIRQQKELYRLGIKNGLLSLTSQNIITTVNLMMHLSIFSLCAYMAFKNNMTIGILTVILAYFTGITERVRFLSEIYLEAQNRISSIQRIYDFMHSPTEKEWKGTEELRVTNGDITFRDVEFAYNQRNQVLKGVTLDIQGGERFALCGKSGSGKTTLAYMLIGFYLPQHGEIEIDGQKLSECSLKSIRQNIGIVQQDILVFDGSVKENLLLGKKNATDEEVIAACERAGLGELLTTLQDGIDTIIGKSGIGLSGGQKQRIAIARIYLKDPKIIIFDEATSALDRETEEQIHQTWSQMLAGRTAIIIAHNQSSVMLCEKMAIIDNGRLDEAGVPSELAKKSDIFRSLFALKDARGEEQSVAN
ncbi:Putative multidrug export ATP-binding/permease protein [Paenibacillus plantiphilus]|uniref:Multidrug export ATP-binding/permease protein n=1 Tax=Paenibacillus plantiphilus TaxID=2905650 RepID=A0ABM9CCT2_9BACL|nr:ABC transporter ATP-binding protein [Paenibacillus plantiphilus]CAH1209523.1 Putative multidrug export ATP-binding/permease protein [Paenibacillus plantiphilus]